MSKLVDKWLLHHASTPQFATSSLWKVTVWFLRLGVLRMRTKAPLRTLCRASSSSKPWPKGHRFDALLLWVTTLRRNLSGFPVKKAAARYPTLPHVKRRHDFRNGSIPPFPRLDGGRDQFHSGLIASRPVSERCQGRDSEESGTVLGFDKPSPECQSTPSDSTPPLNLDGR